MATETVRAEITGTVWKIVSQPGQQLAEEDTILIMESMKMEIPVLAERAGTVAAVRVGEGDVVQEGDILVTIDL